MTALVQPDLPTGRLSFTQVDTYLSCPRKYEFKYIIKPKMVQVGAHLRLGSSLHELIAIMLNAKIKGIKVNTEKLLTDGTKRLDEEFDKIDEALESIGAEPLQPDLRKMYHEQHDGLFKKWCVDILPEFAPTAVEKEYMLTIGGYPFIVYIDAIHAGKRVVDWKVTGSPKYQNNVDNSLQLSVYAIAADVDEVAFCSLVRPREGKERNWKPSTMLMVGRRTKEDKLWAAEIVKSTADAIRAHRFPLCSTENHLCNVKYCDFFPMCRGKKTVQVSVPTWMESFV